MTRTAEKTAERRLLDELETDWLAVYIYYHEDLIKVFNRLVDPLVRNLVSSDSISGFHFILYILGGPHVRLRLRVNPGRRDEVMKIATDAVQTFLDLEPSMQSLDEESIRMTNERILSADPSEKDDRVFPDNSFRFTQFDAEIERYGGPTLLRASLNLFTLSSVMAMNFRKESQDSDRGSQLATAFQVLFQQAFGFALDLRELVDLLRYGVDSWGENMPKIIEKADRVADSNREMFLTLCRQIIDQNRESDPEKLRSNAPATLLALGTRRLSKRIDSSDRHLRVRVGTSQLHMTSSRLGLNNIEEVYLSRLLTGTLRRLRSKPETDSLFSSLHLTEPPAFETLVQRALEQLRT